MRQGRGGGAPHTDHFNHLLPPRPLHSALSCWIGPWGRGQMWYLAAVTSHEGRIKAIGRAPPQDKDKSSINCWTKAFSPRTVLRASSVVCCHGDDFLASGETEALAPGVDADRCEKRCEIKRSRGMGARCVTRRPKLPKP